MVRGGTDAVLSLLWTGWVVFAVKSALSALASNSLLPDPDHSCLVVNAKSGYLTDNKSWVIGRLVRDFDKWKHASVQAHVESMLDARFDTQKSYAEARVTGSSAGISRPTQAGLCIPVYAAGTFSSTNDRLFYASFLVFIVQLGIAAIPLAIWGDWSVFMVTAAGSALSLLTCSLPYWNQEKWACRRISDKSVILTRGNGAQYAILILGDGNGLDLQELAAGSRTPAISSFARLQFTALAALWIVLLITATGVKQHAWFLFAVGAIGIMQDIYIAITYRTPESHGVPLRFVEVIGQNKVMDTLFALEEKYPYAGRSLLDIFFPGKLRPDELARWAHYENTAGARSKGIK